MILDYKILKKLFFTKDGKSFIKSVLEKEVLNENNKNYILFIKDINIII